MATNGEVNNRRLSKQRHAHESKIVVTMVIKVKTITNRQAKKKTSSISNLTNRTVKLKCHEDRVQTKC